MESSPPKRRFPPPWTVKQSGPDAFIVEDANGIRLAAIYCRDDLHKQRWANYTEHLTSDEAERIAKGIARLPELLGNYTAAFRQRGSSLRYWKRSHPYHVALQDAYVQENYDWIVATCKFNGVPFDATGEILERGVRYRSYQFARQIDAIRFWDKFDGRWLYGDEFLFPERPSDLIPMREVAKSSV